MKQIKLTTQNITESVYNAVNNYLMENDFTPTKMDSTTGEWEKEGVLNEEDDEDYFDQEDAIEMAIEDFNYDGPVVITGILGLWDGKRQVEPVECENVKSAINKCLGRDCEFLSNDDIVVDMTTGVMHVKAHHHDGTNEFDITPRDLHELKRKIKKMIRESFEPGMMFDNMPDLEEKKRHTEKSNEPKGKKAATKRAIVLNWLKKKKNAVNGAEIMRQLWNPTPAEEDTKRGEFYKKRDGKINKDSGARYSFSDEEINALYRIKSGRS